MVADLQPPLDCKKIALLGLCPTYDYLLLMDSSIIFWAVMQVEKVMVVEVYGCFFTKVIVSCAIDPLHSPSSCCPSQESVGVGEGERAGLSLSKNIPPDPLEIWVVFMLSVVRSLLHQLVSVATLRTVWLRLYSRRSKNLLS
ncbi:hypothetical protein QUB70_01970 [Microcoleus sp. A003_D6]|uniref:hypothetical protein n=1 Tax=Microcoleus sp. A003_D6 TaxID=3055266 RepID=UPI002FCF78E4